MAFDEKTYLVLVLRYKELSGGGGGGTGDDVPYDLVGYITEIDTGLIDADYMNSRFEKYLKLLNLEGASAEAVEQAETELHKTFATLSQEEQKYITIFLIQKSPRYSQFPLLCYGCCSSSAPIT